MPTIRNSRTSVLIGVFKDNANINPMNKLPIMFTLMVPSGNGEVEYFVQIICNKYRKTLPIPPPKNTMSTGLSIIAVL